MTVIKKQVFRPSKDENLQQFLAKDGAEMRWGQPASQNKAKTRARAAGKIIGVPEKEGDTAKKVKSEPKSPWDDESDALDQGSDNSNSADDTTGKQIKLAVQDAWFDKATSHGGWDETGSTHIPKGMGNELTSGKPGKKSSRAENSQGYRDTAPGDLFPSGTPSTAAHHRYPAADPKQKTKAPIRDYLTDKKKAPTRTPGKGQKAKWVAEDYDADEDGPHKVEGHWESKMQKAVWDAYFEKASGKKIGRRHWRQIDQSSSGYDAERLRRPSASFEEITNPKKSTPEEEKQRNQKRFATIDKIKASSPEKKDEITSKKVIGINPEVPFKPRGDEITAKKPESRE